MMIDTYKKKIDDIPFFSEDRYWGKAPKKDLEYALSVLENKGWDTFLAQYEGHFDFTFEENRADWHFAIPLNKEMTVLDIGAGMGRSSIPLARIAKEVYAVDQSFLRMKFLKYRAEKESLENIHVAVGDIFDLPFLDESFDVIVMNGVLEWVGVTNRFKHARDAQLESIRICKRLLKKGGYLYIGIENRYALSYLHALDHSGIRFTSYMPRFVADIYSYIRKGKKYDTYTYSKQGYQKLLKQAGFPKSTFYLVYPGYNNPRILIPYRDMRTFSYVIQKLMPSTSLRRRIMKRIFSFSPLLSLYRKVFFSFAIFVQK